MKQQIHFIISLVLAGMLLTACEDFLDSPEKSTFSDEIVFANEQLTENMVFNIYSWFAQTNSLRGRFQPFYGMNTDIEIYNDVAVNDQSVLSTYSATPNNSQMSGTKDPNPWTCFYNAIEVANVCIEGIQKYGNPGPNNTMGYLYAEAVALRAVFYYDLLRAWGDVPARFEPVGENSVYKKKSDRDEIYKRLISDLGEIQDYLPWPNGSDRTKTVGRINKAFVKALRARLCLMAAGYGQRPLDLENDHVNSEIRLSNDPDLQKSVLYPIASKELLEIINSKSCKLEDTFEKVFVKNNQDDITAGGEAMFVIPFAAGRGRMLQHFAVYHYDKSKYISTTKKGGQNVPSPTYYYQFDQNDIRRDVVCIPYKWQGGKQVVNTDDYKAGWNWGKYRYEWMAAVRLVTGDDGLKQMYMRYADVLLMYAEVANELSDPETAIDQLRTIRRRAFPTQQWTSKVENYLTSLNSKEKIFQAIVDERAYELGGEMLRKQDLIRWNLLGKKMNETKAQMQALRDRTGAFAQIPERVYYKLNSDNESLSFYGFNVGENTTPGNDWNSIEWQKEVISEKRISNYFMNDPDKKQFWPIFQSDIDYQVGYLVNDYGY